MKGKILTGADGKESKKGDLRLFQAAVTGAGESLLITDHNWDADQAAIVFANPALCQTTGFSYDEMAGKNIKLLFGPKTEAVSRERLENDLNVNASAVYPMVIYKKNGREQAVEWDIKRVRDDTGAVTNYLVFQRDVTERDLLRDQLQQAQKMEAVGRMAGGIAHDFNNLLTVILGYTSLLALEMAPDTPPESKQLRGLNEIQRASERAAELTRQLLAFSRKQTVRTRVVSLNQVLAGMHGMLQRLVGEDVDLEFALDESLGAVQIDVGQMEQVLLNLAANARDAMPQGGMLTFQTRNTEISSRYAPVTSLAAGQYVSLAVTDTGIGMDEATRAQAFEPFFTTKEPGRGTGLGLSTVHALLQQSGGAIEVSSSPGMGTCFTLFLPRVDAATDLHEQAADLATPRGSGVILVVEDDTGIRNLLGELLEGAGYQVLAAADAQQATAIAILQAGPIDLLLTDVILPGASGLDLAERLKATRPHLRVLLVSGYSDHALLRHGNLEPDAAFIQKPFAAETLLITVSHLMQTKSSAQSG